MLPRAMRLGLSIAICAAAATPPSQEHASSGQVRLAVVPVIVSGEHKPALSAIFGAVWSAARSRARLAVMSEEEAFVSSAAELSDHVLDCGPDTRCVAEHLSAVGIDVAMMVVINGQLDPPLLGLQLIDCEKKAVVSESIAKIAALSLEQAELSAEIRTRASKMFDQAGYWQGGRLLVRATPPQAEVRLMEIGADGTIRQVPAPDRISGAQYFLRPGRYRVLAALEGHEDVSKDAEVRVGDESSVSIALSEKSTLAGSPWFWGAAALLVAGGAAAVFLATRKSDRYACAPFPGVDCGSAHP